MSLIDTITHTPTHTQVQRTQRVVQLCSAMTHLEDMEFQCTKEAAIGSIYCTVHAERITQDSLLKIDDHDIDPKVKLLLEINAKMPEQRTQPWYEFRKGRLTASPAASYLLITDYEYDLSEKGIVCKDTKDTKLKKEWIGKKHCGHFSSYKQEIRQQVCPEPWKGSRFMEHGVKYEHIICDIYESSERTKVLNFGIMPHKDISWLAASPDGITSSGKMVEIKAPSREELTKSIILQYWIQMQLQMECCDLDECDFVEGVIKEYYDAEDYYEDKYYNESGEFEYYLNKDGLPKGIVINIIETHPDGTITKQYAYPPALTFENKEDEELWIIEWCRKKVNEKKDNAFNWLLGGNVRFSLSYYYVHKWEIRNVKRDKKWFELRKPDLENVWNLILKYREEGLPEELKKSKRNDPILPDNSTITSKRNNSNTDTNTNTRRVSSGFLFGDDDDDAVTPAPTPTPTVSAKKKKEVLQSQSHYGLMNRFAIPTMDLSLSTQTQQSTDNDVSKTKTENTYQSDVFHLRT